MNYAKLFNKKATSQSQPIRVRAGCPTRRVATLDRRSLGAARSGSCPRKRGWDLLHRERKLTLELAIENALEAIREDGARVVARIAEISESGRAPKNGPAVFALALAASLGDVQTRTLAFAAVPRVCRIGTHLFAFAGRATGCGAGAEGSGARSSAGTTSAPP